MISDLKKVQTLINRLAEAAMAVKAASETLEATRILYLAASPNVTGTALDGNLPAVNAWINDLTTLAGGAVTTAIIAAHMPSHTGDAL